MFCKLIYSSVSLKIITFLVYNEFVSCTSHMSNIFLVLNIHWKSLISTAIKSELFQFFQYLRDDKCFNLCFVGWCTSLLVVIKLRYLPFVTGAPVATDILFTMLLRLTVLAGVWRFNSSSRTEDISSDFVQYIL
jgi:hypothetical protein